MHRAAAPTRLVAAIAATEVGMSTSDQINGRADAEPYRGYWLAPGAISSRQGAVSAEHAGGDRNG